MNWLSDLLTNVFDDTWKNEFWIIDSRLQVSLLLVWFLGHLLK